MLVGEGVGVGVAGIIGLTKTVTLSPTRSGFLPPKRHLVDVGERVKVSGSGEVPEGIVALVPGLVTPETAISMSPV